MKSKNFFLLLAIALLTTTFAQAGIGKTTPKKSLQIEGDTASTTRADGLQALSFSLTLLDAKVAAYGTNQDAASDTWTAAGSTDTSSPTTYQVGDFAQGGIVFWVDETGQHGLVCAKTDQSLGVRWHATDSYGTTRATGDGPFSGELNTSIIISSQLSLGDNGNDFAAQICNDLQITEADKTYGDWYLPSKEELNLMHQNKETIDATANANSGSAFTSYYYWSSTEGSSEAAWAQLFAYGRQSNLSKNETFRVRAVRTF